MKPTDYSKNLISYLLRIPCNPFFQSYPHFLLRHFPSLPIKKAGPKGPAKFKFRVVVWVLSLRTGFLFTLSFEAFFQVLIDGLGIWDVDLGCQLHRTVVTQ